MRRAGIAGAAAILVAAIFTRADSGPPPDAPRYTADGRLLKPTGYREWVFLSAGFGMTYSPPAGEPRFDNVFVSPSAYKRFLETGAWPDLTVLVLEVRGSQSKGSINQGGHFQTDPVGFEVHLKDEKRFPGRWGFFVFHGGEDTAAASPTTANCYFCHEKNGAVDSTFVQFYPTLLRVAKEKGTLKAH